MRSFHIITIFLILFFLNTISLANNPVIIDTHNTDDLQLLNIFGRGRLQGVLWSSQGIIAVETNIGVWIYENLDDTDPHFIANAQALAFSDFLVSFFPIFHAPMLSNGLESLL